MVCDRPYKYIIKEETADSDLIYLTSKYNLTLPESFYEEMKGKSASSNSKRAYTNWQGNPTLYFCRYLISRNINHRYFKWNW